MSGVAKAYQYYLNADFSQYLGKWVAIVDEKVLASGPTAKGAYDEAAKKADPSKILLTRIHSKQMMIL